MFSKTYFAVVHEDKEGPWKYIVEFPDLDHLASEENTLNGVHTMAKDILECKIEDMLERCEVPPEPSEDYDEILKKADPEAGPVAFVLGVHVEV